MKKYLLLSLLALFAIPAISNAQEKNFISTGFNVNVMAVDGESAFSMGIGVGYHRMLGEKVSLGLNLAYAGSGGVNTLETTLGLAFYGRLADKFYYVPEIDLGPVFVFDGGGTGFGAMISPLGLEFRPVGKISFRFNLINLTYLRWAEMNTLNFMIGPSMSVNFRF